MIVKLSHYVINDSWLTELDTSHLYGALFIDSGGQYNYRLMNDGSTADGGIYRTDDSIVMYIRELRTF